MDIPFHSQITAPLVAGRMRALADHYHRISAEAQLPSSDAWFEEVATDLDDIANLVQRDERDAYHRAYAWLQVLRRRAHDRGVPFLAITLTNYSTVVGWLYDAAAR